MSLNHKGLEASDQDDNPLTDFTDQADADDEEETEQVVSLFCG